MAHQLLQKLREENPEVQYLPVSPGWNKDENGNFYFVDENEETWEEIEKWV